jgi:enolase
MNNTSISSVRARQILDSKGKPMLEVDVYTKGGFLGRASSPSGISAGVNEAFVLRDKDPNWFDGLSVFKAVENVHNIIAPELVGMDVLDQKTIDEKLINLDGTKDKSKLGGNTIFSVSLACIKAAARSQNIPLYLHMSKKDINTIPIPLFNCISGGSYQKGSMPFQECTIVPYKANSIMEAVHIGWKMFQKTPEVIAEYQNGLPAKPGSLSGWQAPSTDPIVSFDILNEVAVRCGVADKIAFAADCASSEFYNPERNTYDFIDKEIDLDTLLGFLKELTNKYDFIYVEDPVHEDDWYGWQKAVKVLDRTILVGDDFTVTNIERIKKAYEMNACGGFIFKPNQVGTVTEAVAAHEYAEAHGMLTIPSVRAGGVTNDSIALLFQTPQFAVTAEVLL